MDKNKRSVSTTLASVDKYYEALLRFVQNISIIVLTDKKIFPRPTATEGGSFLMELRRLETVISELKQENERLDREAKTPRPPRQPPPVPVKSRFEPQP